MNSPAFNARIDVVTAHALRVFKNTAAAMEWMTTPHVALADRAPRECCKTEEGAQQVKRILNALEWGGVV